MITEVKEFSETLNRFKINHVVHGKYHVQIQTVHNFYPTKGTYYNSETGKKFKYPEFKDVNEVLMFLGGNVTPEKTTLGVDEIIDILEEQKDLVSAINYFKE